MLGVVADRRKWGLQGASVPVKTARPCRKAVRDEARGGAAVRAAPTATRCSIEHARGRARVLEVAATRARSWAIYLLLTGGGDVDPVFYGERSPSDTYDAEPGATSSRSISRAGRWTRPALSRCRGAQVMNGRGACCSRTFRLAVTTDLAHSVTNRSGAAHHVSRRAAPRAALRPRRRAPVRQQPPSPVGRQAGGSLIEPPPDGVIEAKNRPRGSPGVQWHLENFCSRASSRRSESFVGARERFPRVGGFDRACSSRADDVSSAEDGRCSLHRRVHQNPIVSTCGVLKRSNSRSEARDNRRRETPRVARQRRGSHET